MDVKKSKAADAWRERIVAQLASGQSIRAWCRQQKLHEHSFYWWRSRLGMSPTPAASNPMRFAEVVVDRPAAVDDSIVLRLGGGRELILPASMPPQSIATLVHAIEARA